MRERGTDDAVIERRNGVVECHCKGLRAVVLAKLARKGIAHDLRNEFGGDGGINVEFAFFVGVELCLIVGIVFEFDAVELGLALPVIWIGDKRDGVCIIHGKNDKGAVAIMAARELRPTVGIFGGEGGIHGIKHGQTGDIAPEITGGFGKGENERFVIRGFNADIVLGVFQVGSGVGIRFKFAEACAP